MYTTILKIFCTFALCDVNKVYHMKYLNIKKALAARYELQPLFDKHR